MARIRIEDIAFWILIALIIFVVLWKLVGSPTDTATLISVALFIIGSEILIWKAIFGIEKKTAISFLKIKHYIDNNNKDLKNCMENNHKELISEIKQKR